MDYEPSDVEGQTRDKEGGRCFHLFYRWRVIYVWCLGCGKVEGGLCLPRPSGRFWMDLSTRGGKASSAEGVWRHDRADVSGNRQRGAGRLTCNRATRPRRQQTDLCHVLRLHGFHPESCEELSECSFRTRNRL